LDTDTEEYNIMGTDRCKNFHYYQSIITVQII